MKKLVVAETATSMFNFHLRYIEPDELRPSGGAGPALCGRSLGWDTRIPIETYGKQDHLPSSYCRECADLARKQNLRGAELLKV